MSEEISIGSAAFRLLVFPNDGAKKDMMALFLKNCSDHDVVVDFSFKAMGGASGSAYDLKLEKGTGSGIGNFMQSNKIEGSMKFQVEVIVKSVEIVGETTADSRIANNATEGITFSIGGMDLTGIESEGMLNQDDIHLEESELETLNSQLVEKEAKLIEMWNEDISFVESKGKEMSDLLSKLEDLEEEKAAIEKQVAEVDATTRELQERRGILVTEIKDKDEKLKKFMKKKERFENFIEEKVKESREAKHHLEREIEEIKRKVEDLNKVESMEQPESECHNLRLKWLDSIESKIEAEKRELECPVCLEVHFSMFYFWKT